MALTPRDIAARIRTAYPGAAGVALEAADALDAQAGQITTLEEELRQSSNEVTDLRGFIAAARKASAALLNLIYGPIGGK